MQVKVEAHNNLQNKLNEFELVSKFIEVALKMTTGSSVSGQECGELYRIKDELEQRFTEMVK